MIGKVDSGVLLYYLTGAQNNVRVLLAEQVKFQHAGKNDSLKIQLGTTGGLCIELLMLPNIDRHLKL